MATVPSGRVRRLVAIALLASLVPGLAAPIVAARGQGTSSLYAEWLAARASEPLDERVVGSVGRLGDDRFASLASWLDALVVDLVRTYGLNEAARALGLDPESSAEALSAALSEGLHSLTPGDLPVGTLLTGPDGRAVSGARMTGTGGADEIGPERSPCPGGSPSGADVLLFDTCRPATGGAQPLGP